MRINPQALKTIRERSGMTVSSLARAAEVDRTLIAHIEAGRRNAGPETTLALAKALKVELPAILADPAEAAS